MHSRDQDSQKAISSHYSLLSRPLAIKATTKAFWKPLSTHPIPSKTRVVPRQKAMRRNTTLLVCL